MTKKIRIFAKNFAKLQYTSIGGVKKADIPEQYPKVLDKKQIPDGETSENYYPDWSRAAFMDIRGVKALSLKSIQFQSLKPDEREVVILENCSILCKEIDIVNS